MTTVACKNGVMAADSISVWGGRRCHDEIKVDYVETVNGKRYLIGTAGNTVAGNEFCRWISEGQKGAFERKGQFDALILDEEGKLYLTCGKHPDVWELVRDPFWAIGTGGPYAMGAMQVGATAEAAVAAAIHWDVDSGGSVLAKRL